MSELNIESLFEERYPHASFHDSTIKKVSVDFLTREAKFECVICVGDPDDEDHTSDEAHGVLTFIGLLYIAVEPPCSSYPYEDGGLVIVHDSSVETTEFKTSTPKLPNSLPDGAFAHCFFINNWNSYMFVAATTARFEWS